jgi:hypothetical protein
VIAFGSAADQYLPAVSAQRVANWVLSSVTKVKRFVLDPITGGETKFLASGIDWERPHRASRAGNEILRLYRYRPSGELALAIKAWIERVETRSEVLQDDVGQWFAVAALRTDAPLRDGYTGPEYFDPESEVEEISPRNRLSFSARQEADGAWTWILEDREGSQILESHRRYATQQDVSDDLTRLFGEDMDIRFRSRVRSGTRPGRTHGA